MMNPRQSIAGGFYADGGGVDPVSGNEVPLGSLKEEVRDDVSAKLSPGEFVLPADVVRYIGLERLMKLRDTAKAGLARMEKIGQMGNAEEVQNSNQLFSGGEEEDTAEFESEIDALMKEEEGGEEEEKKFAPGGFLTGEDLSRAPKNPMVDVRYFKNSKDGRVMFITYINQRPTIPIPADFVPYDPTTDTKLKEDEKKAEEKKTTTVAEEGARGRSDGELTPEQKDFLENETPEQRDARMGKINDFLTKATSLLPGSSVISLAKALGLGAKGTSIKGKSGEEGEDIGTGLNLGVSPTEGKEVRSGITPGEKGRAGASGFEEGRDVTSITAGEKAGYGISASDKASQGSAGPSNDSDKDTPQVGDFDGIFAKGGMVARRKYPAKKQKGKGIVASKR